MVEMNFYFRMLSLITCLYICISCGAQVPDPQKTQLARAGLDRDVAELGTRKDFNIVKVVYIDVFNNEHGPGTCYYANAHFIIGSQLPVANALDSFSQHLMNLGWVLHGEKYPAERILVRAENELADVRAGDPGPELEGAANFVELRKVYPSLVFLRLAYGLQEC